MSANLQYEAVQDYLKTYSRVEPPYDFNGLLRLVLAGVENLRSNATDQDFQDFAWTITDDQEKFLLQLLNARTASAAKLDGKQ